MPPRPLSPHLTIYRRLHTMVLSISHRISGLWLALGLVALVYWLMSAGAGESEYERAVAVFSAWYIKALLLGWLAAFCFHLVNGLRHLLWDAGFGLEKMSARVSARWVVALALTSFLAAACVLFCVQGGAL